MDNRLQLTGVNHAIDTLLVYKNARQDLIVQKLYNLAELFAKATESGNKDFYPVAKALYELIAALINKAELLGLKGNIFRKYIIRTFLDDENVFSLASEREPVDKNSSIYKLAKQDMATIYRIMNFNLEGLCKELGKGEDMFNYTPNHVEENAYIEKIELAKNEDDIMESFSYYYHTYGCGDTSYYKTFRFVGEKLVGIANCDTTTFDDIIAYDKQKQAIINNTEAFLDGLPANNVLLIGARGTGKSSCVKALYNQYHERGLRVVEIPKDQLVDLPKILELLKNRGKHFILFIDDLSFDEFEVQYKYMKSLLEGGIEKTPENVLFYATSNRRHLIKEFWSDKQGTEIKDGELHLSDTVNEKLSLSDRFGITINFSKPTMEEYTLIIKGLADKANLGISTEDLMAQAHSWELNQHGLSGRTARQFVNHLICERKR